MSRETLLSLAAIMTLNDQDFAEYLVALLQLSNENPEAEALARNVWRTMTPEERVVMLRFMGMKV